MTHESAARPAPPASDFPAADGRPLQQVLPAVDLGGAGRLPRRPGPARGREPLLLRRLHHRPGADPRRRGRHLRRPGNLKGPAEGPFPARIESLETEAAFRAKSTADDPDAAKVVYISDVPLQRPGKWAFAALVKQGDGYTGSLVPTPSLVGQFDPPDVGDEAPPTRPRRRRRRRPRSPRSTPGSRRAPCTTRTSRTCSARSPWCSFSPRPRSARAVSAARWSTSPSRSSATPATTSPSSTRRSTTTTTSTRARARQVDAYGLPSEPWLFVIDREGRHHHHRDRGRLQRRGACRRRWIRSPPPSGGGVVARLVRVELVLWLTMSWSRCSRPRPSAGSRR